ncbi:MAG TPA: FAD-dependent oxidoreductase [Flavobacterium sp.]|jgi:glycine/D-amino acid oxidase-like deaminating enzyme/nitrite reductase/ring-hydroxylating ferredoxin subunit
MDYGQLHDKNGIISLWRSYSAGTNFNSLSGNITTQVAIIGGGITGITTAQLLKEAGFEVVVLEAMKVGGGNTGHSTGNLYVAIEEGFDTIKSKYDNETLATVISGRSDAINLIADNVTRFSLDCDFRRQPWYSYASNSLNAGKIEKIQKAGIEAGATINDVSPGEVPFGFKKAIRIDNQAQFNPLRYTQQLAVAIADDACRIYEDTRVTSIHEDDDFTTIKTTNGQVRATYVIHATHTPKGLMPDFHSLLGTYREYGIAAKLNSGNYPEGTFWGYYNMNDRYSIRSYEHEGEKYMIVVGQPHEVGQKENNLENIENLEKFLRERFDVAEITNRWGGQNYKPADGLPYIGRKNKGSNVFIATGFSTDGLTYGTLSAMIIRDMMLNRENDYTRVFDATRHNPMKAAAKFIKENALNATHLLNDYVFFKDPKLSEIPRDQGKVVEVEGKKLAVYHTAEGEMKACSAICTHMGCVVHWNGAEKTWDCPCHASRFDVEGGVIEGPALTPLKQMEVRK